jgi:hypothetical protein
MSPARTPYATVDGFCYNDDNCCDERKVYRGQDVPMTSDAVPGRGKLTLFVGYAPGVGKTRALLDASGLLMGLMS